jgi:hypothetical protein
MVELPYIVTVTVEEWDRMYAERTDEYADARFGSKTDQNGWNPGLVAHATM